jgi:hypothetical protein
MAIATSQCVFPLLTTGLSRSFAQWLRVAGISFKSYEPGTSLARFFSENRERLLIFDSRNPLSRHEAETALQFGCENLDLAPSADEFSTRESAQAAAAPAEWTLRLCRLLRRSGRIWLRVHDLPAGCEAIVLREALEDTPRNRQILEGTSFLAEQGSTYIPSPHFGREDVVDKDDFELEAARWPRGAWWKARLDLPARVRQGEDRAIWSPGAARFEEWRSYRERLQLEVSISEDTIRIEVHNLLPKAGVPLLELWRENHVARFPVVQSPLVLKRSGMVYEQSGGRHPAGLFLSKGLGHTSRPSAGHEQPFPASRAG